MFENRQEAGRKLALKIKAVLKEKDFVVAGITRGGVVLGRIIADYFKTDLEILVIKKIGAPFNPELAIGAVGPKKTICFDESLIEELRVDVDYKARVQKAKLKERDSMEEELLGGRKLLSFKNKKVVVVDDGVATGNTVTCASLFLRKQKAKRIILAIPVIAKDRISVIKGYFDKVISLETVGGLSSVSEFYKYFPQVETKEVIKLI